MRSVDAAAAASIQEQTGFASRGSMKLLSHNSSPLYTFYNDTGPSQSNGENTASGGETSDIASAPATTAAGNARAARVILGPMGVTGRGG